MTARGRRAAAALVVSLAVLAASSLACAYYSGVPEFDEEEAPPAGNQPAQAQQQAQQQLAELGLTETAVAEIIATRAAVPSPDAPQAEAAPSSHTPVITDIDFPGVALLNVRTDGTIYFRDAARDVNLINIQTLEGTFPSGSRDPTPDIIWVEDEGRMPLAGVCGRQEFVRATITLRDAAGNLSKGETLAFYCQ